MSAVVKAQIYVSSPSTSMNSLLLIQEFK